VRRFLAVLAVLFSLSACTHDKPALDDAGSTSSSSSSSSTSSTSSSSTSTPAGGPACPANTKDQTAAAQAPRAEMTDLRTGRQDGFDRVVFEFTGTSPGFKAGYVDKPVTQDGSGAAVALDGDYAIEVRMENASGYHFDGDKSGPTYTGAARVRPGGTAQVVEVVRTGDFEGYLTWAIGVKDKVGFRVSRLDGPPRLLVEVCG
jgi:hypothetical protein